MPKTKVPQRQRSGRPESRIALGTAQLGMAYGTIHSRPAPSTEDAQDIIHLAIKSGINWLDTARAYGNAESLVGAALADVTTPCRVVTKLSPLRELKPDVNEGQVRKAVNQSVERSLNELQSQTIDVMLLHEPHHREAFNGCIWQELQSLHERGVITELGLSVYTPEQALAVLDDTVVKHIQLPFNLLDYRWHEAGVPAALSGRPDIRVHTRSAFLQGLLISDKSAWPNWVNDPAQYLVKLDEIAASYGCSNRLELCLAYVLGQEWIDATVIGADTPEQLQASLNAATAVELTQQDCDMIRKSLSYAPGRLVNPARWRRG